MDPINIVVNAGLWLVNGIFGAATDNHHRLQYPCNEPKAIEQLGDPAQFSDFRAEGYDKSDNLLCSAAQSGSDTRIRYRMEWNRDNQTLVVTKLD